MQPLEDITVVDLSVTLPGPYATKLLGQLGASVVSIEPPAGDPLRHREPRLADGRGELYERLNRGKTSLEVDLKTDRGVTLVRDLAAEADVVVEGFRPGTAEKLGVGPAELRKEDDELIYCSLSGFGQTGPREQQPGHDLNYLGLAGLLDPTDPSLLNLPVGDFAGGTMLALAVLAAIRARDRGASGQYIDVGLFEVLASWNTWNLPWADDESTGRDTDPLIGGAYPCYNTYETADGRYLTLGILETKFWETLCEYMGLPDLVDEQFQHGGREGSAYEELQAVFVTQPLEHWVSELSAEIPLAAVQSPEEAVTDSQLAARDQLFAFDADTGETLREFGFPVQFSSDSLTSSFPTSGTPLEQAGYDTQRLGALQQAGVVGEVSGDETD